MSGEPCGQRAHCGKVDGCSKPGPYNDPIIGCLLESVVDAMNGMVTQVRLPWRGDETNSSNPYDRLRRSAVRATCNRVATGETPPHEHATISIRTAAD